MIYGGSDLLSYGFWLLPTSVRNKLDRRHTERLRKRDNLLAVELGEGVGEEPNHKTARKPWSSRNHAILAASGIEEGIGQGVSLSS